MGRFSFFFLLCSCVFFAGCVGPLYKAAFNGDVAAIKSLAASGTDINAYDGKVYLYTPLMVAAMEGRTEAVKALLELGADPIAEDSDRLTASKLARKYGHEEIAEILDEAEAKRRAVFAPGAPPVRRPPVPPRDEELERLNPTNIETMPYRNLGR